MLRLPGYVNLKRLPHQAVKLLGLSAGLRYGLEDFQAFADRAALAPKGTPNGEMCTDAVLPDVVAVVPLKGELLQRFEEFAADDRSGATWLAYQGGIGDGSSDSRFVLIKRLRKAGWSPGDILRVVNSRPWTNRHSGLTKDAHGVVRHVHRVLDWLEQQQRTLRS